MDQVQGIWKSKSLSLVSETTKVTSSLTKMMVKFDQNYDYINFIIFKVEIKITEHSTYDRMSVGNHRNQDAFDI
jgi:hypothetical protein